MITTRITGLLAGAILAASTVLGGCKKQEDTSAPAGAADRGTPPVRMVYIAKNTGNPYFDPMIEGFRKAAEETGAEFSTVSPASAEATSQLPIIKDQVQRGVNVLAISPNSPDALVPALQDAMRRGITVVTVDADLTGNEHARTAGVLTVDPETVGSSQIELLGSMIGYRGQFAILSATTDAPNQNIWISYMKRTLETDPKYKEMKLVEIVYGNDDPQKSLTEAETLMSKYPELRGIIAPTTVGIAAAAQAVETAKKADRIKVTGLGTPNQMRRFVKNGTVEAFALWSPYDEGYLAGHLGYQLARAKIKAAAGASFTAGTLGERVFREKQIVITGPPMTFNKDNIDRFNF